MLSGASAQIAVSRTCNSGCSYCRIWEEGRPGADTDDLVDLLEQLAEVGVQHVAFTGGEPLLRGDLEMIVARASELRLSSSLTTNALLMDAARVASLHEAGLGTVVVSLDSIDPDVYRRLRGRPLAPVLQAIEDARRLFSGPADLAVSAVLTRPALPGLHELAEWCANRDIPLSLQPLHGSWGESATQRDVDWLRIKRDDEGLLMEALSAVERGSARANGQAYFRALADYSLGRHQSDQAPCEVGRTSIVVHWDLCVSPCWGLPRVQWSGGTSLSEVLASSDYRELVRQAEEGQCPGCWLACHHDKH